MGILLFVLLVILALVLLLGAGGYSVRRYWSPAGSEVIATGDTGAGAGAGAAAILAVVVLVLLFFGLTQWNWFGTRSSTLPTNAAVTAQPSGGGGASPSSKASPT